MLKTILTCGRILCFLLGVLCLIYGILVMRIGSGTKFFMVWLGLGVLFCIPGVLLNEAVWRIVPAPVKIAVWFVILIALVFFIVTEVQICDGFGEDGERDLDYIVVLGAQIHENGPSVVLKYRLDKAREYLEENPDTICIVSGAQGYNEPCTNAHVR